MLLLLLFGASLAAGIVYQWLGSRADAQQFPPPGRLVPIGGCRLHLHQAGSGEPVVVLEAGIAGSSLGWSLVQPLAAKLTTVCSYDRAGLGWSDPSKARPAIGHIVSQLDQLLTNARLPKPYVLVGHSFGGLIIRAYAHFHPHHVAGVLFVDPVSLAYWSHCEPRDLTRLARGANLSRRGSLLARIGLVRLALASLISGEERFPKLIARSVAKPGTGILERLIGEVRKLPPDVWPMVRAHWCRAGSFETMASYLQLLPRNAAAALEMPLPPNVPFTILSAASATAEELEERESWVTQSTSGKHIRIPDSGHWIQLEYPEAVVSALQDLLTLIRTNSSQ